MIGVNVSNVAAKPGTVDMVGIHTMRIGIRALIERQEIEAMTATLHRGTRDKEDRPSNYERQQQDQE
jgi:hypothetical protein